MCFHFLDGGYAVYVVYMGWTIEGRWDDHYLLGRVLILGLWDVRELGVLDVGPLMMGDNNVDDSRSVMVCCLLGI